MKSFTLIILPPLRLWVVAKVSTILRTNALGSKENVRRSMFKFSEYNTESVGSVARKSLKLGNMNKKYNDNIITEDM